MITDRAKSARGHAPRRRCDPSRDDHGPGRTATHLRRVAPVAIPPGMITDSGGAAGGALPRAVVALPPGMITDLTAPPPPPRTRCPSLPPRITLKPLPAPTPP